MPHSVILKSSLMIENRDDILRLSIAVVVARCLVQEPECRKDVLMFTEQQLQGDNESTSSVQSMLRLDTQVLKLVIQEIGARCRNTSHHPHPVSGKYH
jgi:hypothetical protein